MLSSKLDGRSVRLDPGPHTLVFERQGSEPVEKKVVLHEGERSVTLDVRFDDKPVVSPPPIRKEKELKESRPIPPLAYVAGAVAAIGLGSFAFFSVSGRLDETGTLERCQPNCAHADVESVRTRYLVADVSLIVSLLAAGSAGVLFWTRPTVSHR